MCAEFRVSGLKFQVCIPESAFRRDELHESLILIGDSCNSSLQNSSLQNSSLRNSPLRNVGSRRLVPLQNIQLTLIWPIFPAHDEVCFHRILQFVEPLFAIALAAPKLAVEEIFLPDWFLCRVRPAASRVRPPKFHPALERCGWKNSWRAKEMNVIRHDDISPHKPMAGFAPRRTQLAHGSRGAQAGDGAARRCR